MFRNKWYRTSHLTYCVQPACHQKRTVSESSNVEYVTIVTFVPVLEKNPGPHLDIYTLYSVRLRCQSPTKIFNRAKSVAPQLAPLHPLADQQFDVFEIVCGFEPEHLGVERQLGLLGASDVFCFVKAVSLSCSERRCRENP